MKNPYSDRIVKRIEAQTDKGIRKYGADMKDNPLHLTALEVLEYAAEENADQAIYIEKAKEMIEEMLEGGKFTDKFPVRGLMLGLIEGSISMNEVELRINGYMMIEKIKTKGEVKLDMINKAFKDSQRSQKHALTCLNHQQAQSSHTAIRNSLEWVTE